MDTTAWAGVTEERNRSQALRHERSANQWRW